MAGRLKLRLAAGEDPRRAGRPTATRSRLPPGTQASARGHAEARGVAVAHSRVSARQNPSAPIATTARRSPENRRCRLRLRVVQLSDRRLPGPHRPEKHPKDRQPQLAGPLQWPHEPMSALGNVIGSRISDGCQSAQMGTCQSNSVAVWHRTCDSAEYFDHTRLASTGA